MGSREGTVLGKVVGLLEGTELGLVVGWENKLVSIHDAIESNRYITKYKAEHEVKTISLLFLIAKKEVERG